jgi:hypothetical protein
MRSGFGMACFRPPIRAYAHHMGNHPVKKAKNGNK